MQGYYFRFNGSIPKDHLPDSCNSINAPCNSNKWYECDKFVDKINKEGCAFKIKADGSECALLGETNKFKTYLLYDNEPAKGVVLEYTGGYDESTKKNRILKVELQCPHIPKSKYILEESLMINTSMEVRDNIYKLRYITPLACPINCRINGENNDTLSICSSNGICAMDFKYNITRCLCDTGYEGRYCQNIIIDVKENEKNQRDSKTGYIVVITMLSLLVIAAVGATVLTYKKWKSKYEILHASQFAVNTSKALLEDQQETGQEMDNVITLQVP